MSDPNPATPFKGGVQLKAPHLSFKAFKETEEGATYPTLSQVSVHMRAVCNIKSGFFVFLLRRVSDGNANYLRIRP